MITINPNGSVILETEADLVMWLKHSPQFNTNPSATPSLNGHAQLNGQPKQLTVIEEETDEDTKSQLLLKLMMLIRDAGAKGSDTRTLAAQLGKSTREFTGLLSGINKIAGRFDITKNEIYSRKLISQNKSKYVAGPRLNELIAKVTGQLSLVEA